MVHRRQSTARCFACACTLTGAEGCLEKPFTNHFQRVCKLLTISNFKGKNDRLNVC